MTPKYLDGSSVIINLILTNISIIAAFWGAGYKSKLTIKGYRKWGHPQTMLIVVDVLLLAVFSIAETFYQKTNGTVYQGTGLIAEILILLFSQIIWLMFIVTFSSVLASFFLFGKNKEFYNGQELDQKYVDFTNEVGTNHEVYIIAGDFGFLGRLPEEEMPDAGCKERIKKVYKSKRYIDCNAKTNSPTCDRCFLRKKQLEQIVKMKATKSVNLKILCRAPKSDETAYRNMIGLLASLFNDNIFRFYTEDGGPCPDLPLRGRIISTSNGERKMFSHFVKQKDQYETVNTSADATPIGKTYIGLYTALWQSAKQDSNLVASCRQNFEDSL